jgi:predicted nucleic acid-binding protein
MAWVADGSVTLALILPEEASDAVEARLGAALRKEPALVPPLWWYEVSNALLTAVRRKRLTADEMEAALERLSNLPFDVDHLLDRVVAADIRRLAAAYDLTAYDAAYLELASRHRAALATLDDHLQRAARSAGLNVL